MEFKYSALYVEKVKETLTFYQKTFGFDIKFIPPEENYGELITGNTTIPFPSFELGNSNLSNGYQASDRSGRPFGIELAFITSDIQQDFKKAIQARSEILEPIKVKTLGQHVGYLIELATPIAI
ncbi:VOC family protein [Jiulongibacter sediminis]|jgi:uncharacterized glyoxalase superfamily protein PhnB|uniref:VOC family protein n=1 Tax=Jiulongibacter sediminis TaxID=1605367 RepID=UPI0026F0734F|nr:VOC family protein [Jiulongibacter sediminis]